MHGIFRAFLIPATQIFLDRAVDFTVQKADLSSVVFGLFILTSAHVCRQLAHGIHHILMIMHYRRAEGVFSLEIHRKLSRLPPVDFEYTQKLDDINKAVQGKDEAVWFTGGIWDIFIFHTPYFIFIALYFAQIQPILVVLLALVFTPTFLSYIFRAKVFAQAEDRAAPIRREFDYYELSITGREYFKETRILGAFSFFKSLYAESLALLNKLVFRASVKSSIAELLMKLLSLCGYIGTLLLLYNLLMKGEISVGAFAAIFTSMDMVFSLMEQLFYTNIGESAKNFSKVQNYLRFLQMPERVGLDTELPTDADIVLHNVSFSYPGTEHKAVDDISLTIKNGETIAVVGENGSGKTTLVRLITGLYLPDEGGILYGEVDTKETSAFTFFRNISAVFQKYQRYQMTLRENIAISDFNEKASDSALDKVSIQAGVEKNNDSFPFGYDTMLSREFDGVDLSGGEWQRVAIARSFFRSHRYIVLDEPTAAIDPIEETNIYNRFAEISKDKTAIVVTHRLGSVKFTDKIIVMKQGKLVEQGTHTELITLDGEYARLYKTQEQWYKD
jgi:ATP-binding cassette subfamily B protein